VGVCMRWNRIHTPTYPLCHGDSQKPIYSIVAPLSYNTFMQCPNCDFNNPDGLIFCGMCGTQLGKACSTCHAIMPITFKYCGTCGSLMEADGSGLGVETPSNNRDKNDTLPEPASLPSPLESGSLIGERRRATVLISDVKGSTSILEKIGSESWVEVMNQVLQIMGGAVYMFGGEVDQFRGDGMVAFFGARSAHEDDPERAIMAALVLLENIEHFAEQLKQSQNLDLAIRIGINTGDVITANIGNQDTHSEDTAMGGAITLAARLEAAAEPGTVLVSEQTQRLVEERFKWQSLGEIDIRGLSQPIHVYRPMSPRSEAEQQHRLQAYGRSVPLIGRDDELETIQRSLENLRNHVGGIILISGEAGMGKSRLTFEARQQANRVEALQGPDDCHLTWLEGRCRSYGHTLPYSVWIDLWQRWLGSGDWTSEEEDLKQLRVKAQHLWGDQIEAYYPYVAASLSLPLENEYKSAIQHLDAEGLKHRFFSAIYSWLEILSKEKPVILLFAEAHWADEASLELLKYCLPLCTTERVLFVTVYRPERDAPIWPFQQMVETEYYHRLTTIELDPLTDKASHDLLHILVGVDVLPKPIHNQILDKAAGNPYYLTELVYSLIDNKTLIRDEAKGCWQPITEEIRLELPDTLKSLLFSRLDSLSTEERRTLQMASVIGPIFWYEVLQHLTGNGESLNKALASMQRFQLINERGKVPYLGREFAFTSTLIREVAYESILTTQCEGLHLATADYLVESVADSALQHYHGIIAYHYNKAGNCQKELFHTMLAAEEAKRIYANNEAIQTYKHAIELMNQTGGWDCIPPGNIIEAWRLEALKGIGQIQFGIGEVAEAEENLRQAIELGRQIDLAPEELTRLFHWLGEVYFWENLFLEPVQLGEEGLAILGDNNQSTEAALMNQLVAIGSAQLGDHDKFIDFTLRTAGFIQRLPYSEELRAAYSHIIHLYVNTLKNIPEAQRWLELLFKIATEIQDQRALGEYYLQSGRIAFECGDLREAIRNLKLANEKFNTISDIKHASQGWRNLGACYLQQGDIDQAITGFDKALELTQIYENKAHFAIVQWYKAQALLCKGDLEAALASYEEMEINIKDIPQLREEWALSGVGRVHLSQGDKTGAIPPLQQALENSSYIFFERPYQANELLSSLEQAMSDSENFRTYLGQYRKQNPELYRTIFNQWFLSETDVSRIDHLPGFKASFADKGSENQDGLTSLKKQADNILDDWEWVDPFGDCEFKKDKGLVIQAANERNLYNLNHSAPRLLYKNEISGDFTIQANCQPVFEDRPSIGGILIWQSEKYWFCLEAGTRGKDEISFRGFMENNNLIFGRGQLESFTKTLRLERRGNRLNAYCSGNGEDWFFAGAAEFLTTLPVSLGIHANGHIHRMIYPGAYPEGTSIRFLEFTLW